MLTDMCTIIISEFLRNKYKVVSLNLEKNPIDYDMYLNVDKQVQQN